MISSRGVFVRQPNGHTGLRGAEYQPLPIGSVMKLLRVHQFKVLNRGIQ